VPNGPQLAQAIAQMLTRIGLRASVSTGPSASLTPLAARGGTALFLTSWGNNTGDAGGALRDLLHSPDRERALGAQNIMRTAHADVDHAIRTMLVTFDPAARQAMIQRVMGTLMDRVSTIPLFSQAGLFAARAGIEVRTNPAEYLLAQDVHPR
jgi:peptide/nickel transport system substrate-binding protein